MGGKKKFGYNLWQMQGGKLGNLSPQLHSHMYNNNQIHIFEYSMK